MIDIGACVCYRVMGREEIVLKDFVGYELASC